jgi:hypothetical protein
MYIHNKTPSQYQNDRQNPQAIKSGKETNKMPTVKQINMYKPFVRSSQC